MPPRPRFRTHGRVESNACFNFPTHRKVVFCLRGWSERVSAMIRKICRVEIVVPTVLAVGLAIVLSIGAVYLTDIFLGPIDQLEAHQIGSH
jgi:hypothetical protein